MLPMIDVTHQGKRPAQRLVGMLSETWRPSPRTASPSSCRVWRSADPTTAANGSICRPSRPISIGRCMAKKLRSFFDKLLGAKNVGKPLMRPYLDAYWDLYWDLHLGVKGDAIPPQVRQIG